MAVADKLAEMAAFASEVQDLLDKEVELLEFTKKTNEAGQTALLATTKTGTTVQPEPTRLGEFGTGGWFFCHIVRLNGQVLAQPLAKFSPELYFEAKPIEQLWVEKTFEREQKKFQTEVGGDVIEWTPLTKEVTIHPNGQVELGEFAQYFQGLAFANIGKAKGEAAPLLGVAPTASKNSYRIENDRLIVPRLDRVLQIREPQTFAAEWNEERKMLLVYLEGVSPAVKL